MFEMPSVSFKMELTDPEHRCSATSRQPRSFSPAEGVGMQTRFSVVTGVRISSQAVRDSRQSTCPAGASHPGHYATGPAHPGGGTRMPHVVTKLKNRLR